MSNVADARHFRLLSANLNKRWLIRGSAGNMFGIVITDMNGITLASSWCLKEAVDPAEAADEAQEIYALGEPRNAMHNKPGPPAPSQPEAGKHTRYELTLTHEELDTLESLLKHEIPTRFWTGPCPDEFQPLIALACTVAGIKSRATVGGYWCQNCSLTLVEKQGGICRACQNLLKENHAKTSVRDGGPHGPVLRGPDAA